MVASAGFYAVFVFLTDMNDVYRNGLPHLIDELKARRIQIVVPCCDGKLFIIKPCRQLNLCRKRIQKPPDAVFLFDADAGQNVAH